MLGLAKSYKEIVQRYRTDHGNGQAEIRYFRNQPDLTSAVRLAALAQGPNNRTFSHQWRVPCKARAAAADYLVAKQHQLRAATTFSDLLEMIDSTIGPVPGIGELTVYDTAVRIGAFLRILPDRIYLHAGVRTGAVALGFEPGRAWLELEELPKELQVLHPHQAEDVLCIFREDLRSINETRPAGNATRSASPCNPSRHHLTRGCC